MVIGLFFGYLVVEVAALIALVSTIGFGWTVLVLLISYLVGIAVAGAQVKRQLVRLRSAIRGGSGQQGRQGRQGRQPWQIWQGNLTDGALVALGTLLVVVPGLVSTVLGLLLLWPVTRVGARPVLTTLAAGGLGRRAPVITAAAFTARRYAHYRRGPEVADADVSNPDFIDAEVIEVIDTPADAPAEAPADAPAAGQTGGDVGVPVLRSWPTP